MAKNYKDYSYFENRPDVVKIFDDLESFHNHCRLEGLPFNEADLYNNRSYAWRNYQDKINGRKPAFKKYNNGYKKPYQARQ